MGRRPNRRVLEYFDRGARLDDNSNRYEHRCKACGEHFPKGRTETLIAHIERRCPSIRSNNTVCISSPANATYHPAADKFVHPGTILENPNGLATGGTQLVLPANSRQSLSGLEALAMASRQLEHPAKPDTNGQPRNRSIDPDLERPSSSFASSTLPADIGDNGRIFTGTSTVISLSFDYTADYSVAYSTSVGDGSHAVSGESIANAFPSSHDPFTGVRGPQDYASLSKIAASATDLEAMMPQSSGGHQDQATTATAHGAVFQSPTTSDAPVNHSENTRPTVHVDDAAKRKLVEPVPGLSSNPTSTPEAEYGAAHQTRPLEKPRGRAQKIRGKFTDTRRQEVQNIRKKGACIRCRMLRKTVGPQLTPVVQI